MNYILQTDGGSRGNPGPSAAGWVIYTETKDKRTTLKEGSKFLGIQTNNFAEYSAIVEGLKDCILLKIKTLYVKLDSELATKQINGLYKVKNPAIKDFVCEIHDLQTKFNSITFEHVYRSDNKEADAMVNKCLDEHKKLR